MATKLKQKFKAEVFAKDILAKRESESITYAKAAKALGFSQSILHRAESGLPVSLESFSIICNWLGKPVNIYF
jgi:transcriptional regulator with XRE-family HTH domain